MRLLREQNRSQSVPATGLKVQVDYGQKVTFIKEIQLVMRSPLNDVGTAVKRSFSDHWAAVPDVLRLKLRFARVHPLRLASCAARL